MRLRSGRLTDLTRVNCALARVVRSTNSVSGSGVTVLFADFRFLCSDCLSTNVPILCCCFIVIHWYWWIGHKWRNEGNPNWQLEGPCHRRNKQIIGCVVIFVNKCFWIKHVLSGAVHRLNAIRYDMVMWHTQKIKNKRNANSIDLNCLCSASCNSRLVFVSLTTRQTAYRRFSEWFEIYNII